MHADVLAVTCADPHVGMARCGAVAGSYEVMSIVDADDDLAALLDDAERERARRDALTRVRGLSTGAWDAAAAVESGIHHRGFLVVDGLLMRPWNWDEDGLHVHAEVGWAVLEPTRLVVLDHGLVARMVPWPELGLELFSRGTRRAHQLAVALAIAHHQRVDDRVLLTLWHVAERWGRVGREGIVVDLPLSHQRLADLVGAHRPSVTSALGELAKAGAVSRRESGEWLLHGQPPEQLRNHPLAAAMT